MVTDRMLRIPLQYYKAPGITETLVRPVLRLSVQVGPRRFEDLHVLFDSATPLTTIPVAESQKIRLAIPQRSMELTLVTATGKAQLRRHPFGVIENYRLTLDGTYALEAPYGWLIVERLR